MRDRLFDWDWSDSLRFISCSDRLIFRLSSHATLPSLVAKHMSLLSPQTNTIHNQPLHHSHSDCTHTQSSFLTCIHSDSIITPNTATCKLPRTRRAMPSLHELGNSPLRSSSEFPTGLWESTVGVRQSHFPHATTLTRARFLLGPPTVTWHMAINLPRLPGTVRVYCPPVVKCVCFCFRSLQCLLLIPSIAINILIRSRKINILPQT